jgi:lipoprotein-releasing system permease protein
LNTSWFIARRLLQSNKESKQLSTPIVKIAVGGIALGVCVMLVSMAIVTGFQQEIRAKVIGFGAHIQIGLFDTNHSFEAQPIESNQDFLAQLKTNKEIKHIQTFASKAGIIKSEKNIEGVLFKGVSVDFDWSFFRKHLVEGKLPNVKDTAKSLEILISRAQSKALKLKPGDKLLMYFVQDPPKTRKFTISGIYDTGLGENEFDKLLVLGDIRVVQQLNNWAPSQISGFEIYITDFNRLEAVDEEVYQTIPNNFNSASIAARYPQIFGWLDLMDTNVYIIIFLMLIVSLINMITSLLIMILEKTKMIGLLKTLGGNNQFISSIFLKQALALTTRGVIIGNIAGITLCLLQKKFEFFSLNQETYYLKTVPIQLDILPVVLLNLLVFAVSIAALLLPTFIVNRIKPASAIKFD